MITALQKQQMIRALEAAQSNLEDVELDYFDDVGEAKQYIYNDVYEHLATIDAEE